MTRRHAAAALLCTALLVAPAAAHAQTDQLQINAVDEADYPSVRMTVTVPPQLAEVALPPTAFEVSENGEPRGRPSLGQVQGVDEPAAPRTVLAIDTSGSMSADIERARTAAADFVRSLRPGSQVAVVTFGDDVSVVTEFTADGGAVLENIAAISVDPSAETALYDGVRRANKLASRGPDDVPTSIVLLADGENSAGTSSLDDAVSELTASGVPVWAVALQTGTSNRDTLVSLAGSEERVLSADNADDLQGIYLALASNLSRQYVLRYDSQAEGETDIGLDLASGPIRASTSVTHTIDATAQPQPDDVVRVVSPDPYTVRVPPLGTAAAYSLGLGALALATVLLVWVVSLAPRQTTSRTRLLGPLSAPQRPGLTTAAEWVADRADRQLRGRRLGTTIDEALESAGVDMRTGEFAVGVLSITVVVYALGFIVANAVVGIILAVMVPLAARLVLSIMRDKRQAAFSDQFIDVLQLLAGSLRAGYGLLQGIDAVSRDAQEPAASEFRRILVEHRLGRDLTEAMDNCATRMGNDDFAWVVQAISIHRDVGGDLARVLDNIVGTVRERASVHRQVRALSAEGRLSARVLTALPLLVVLVISIMDPSYFRTLLSQPIGWALIAVAGVMLLTGSLLVRRLVKIRY